jgi:hypothetical protein
MKIIWLFLLQKLLLQRENFYQQKATSYLVAECSIHNNTRKKIYVSYFTKLGEALSSYASMQIARAY